MRGRTGLEGRATAVPKSQLSVSPRLFAAGGVRIGYPAVETYVFKCYMHISQLGSSAGGAGWSIPAEQTCVLVHPWPSNLSPLSTLAEGQPSKGIGVVTAADVHAGAEGVWCSDP